MGEAGEKVVLIVGGIHHEIIVKTLQNGEKIILNVGGVNHEILVDSMQKDDKPLEIQEMNGKNVQPSSRLWNLLDNPNSSVPARLYYCVSLSTLLIYLLAMVLNTIPSIILVDSYGNQYPNPVLTWIQVVCAIICTMEIVPRFIFSPSKKEFIMSGTTIVDIVASLQFMLVFILRLAGFASYHGNIVTLPLPIYDEDTRSSFFVQEGLIHKVGFGLLTVLGYAWILKLVRYSSTLQTFFSQLWSTRNHLFLLIQVLIVMVLLFGSLAFWAENDEPDTMFYSLPNSFYWALITITTVGYGDIFPTTVFGQIVSCVCAVSGVTTIIIITTITAITITKMGTIKG